MESGLINQEYTPRPTTKEKAEAVAKTIREVKMRFQSIDKAIRESKIPNATVDVNKLIKSECRKNKVKEGIVREIANWQKTQIGESNSKMMITSEDWADSE